MKKNTNANVKTINKKERGITLIALIVTIVILLILSGVSIAILTGKNGVINQAKDAKEKYKQSSSNEEIGLNELSKELKNDIKRKGTLEVVETTEDSLKVKMSTDNASEYQFSLDGNNWTDSQKQNEYIFTGLDKVIANANNYTDSEYQFYFNAGQQSTYVSSKGRKKMDTSKVYIMCNYAYEPYIEGEFKFIAQAHGSNSETSGFYACSYNGKSTPTYVIKKGVTQTKLMQTYL